MFDLVPDWISGDFVADIARGVVVTIVLTVLTSLVSMVIGVLTALGRTGERGAVRRASTGFVEIFRNVPALILLIFFAFAVPNLFPIDVRRRIFFQNPVVDSIGELTSLPLPYYAIAAVVALSANTGAHLCEVIRAGIGSIDPQRFEVARSLGASRTFVHRTITVPDAVRISFPGITNRLVHNLKNTALVGFVAVPDAFHEIQATITRTFRATATLTFAALLYLVLAALLELGMRRIERSLWRGRPITRSVDV